MRINELSTSYTSLFTSRYFTITSRYFTIAAFRTGEPLTDGLGSGKGIVWISPRYADRADRILG